MSMFEKATAFVAWPDTQPRYQAYAMEHGAASREEMIERDRVKYPGGHMVGFMFWVQDQWSIWDTENGGHKPIRTSADHQAFDAWLQARAALKSAEGR